MSLKEIYF